MAIPKEFLREDKIKAIVMIKNLKTDEIYLYKTDDAVTSYSKERFKLDLGMHPVKSLQDAYSSLGLELFTFEIDKEANKKRGEDTMLSTEASKVKVAIIPTNEELAIARDTVALV